MNTPRSSTSTCARCIYGFLAVLLGASSVTVLAECDTTPPQLTDLAFSPNAINVTAGPAGVTCAMTLSDALAGVAEATCSFRAPGFFQVHSCVADAPSVGDRNNGTFSCTVDIPRYAEAGTWRASVAIVDTTGNARLISDFELEFSLFLPVDLEVTSNSDLVPPALSGFDFNTKTPDVSGGAVDVVCSVGVSDALAGVNRTVCFFQRPSDDYGYACLAFAPSSGNRNNGTFTCNVTVQQYSEAGDWTANVLLYDEVENSTVIDGATLQGLGHPNTLTVTSSPTDLAPPILTDFDFNPKNLDVAAASAMVTCTVDVTDNLAGVEFVTCNFDSPSFLQRGECATMVPVAGSDTNGTFSCSVVIPQYSDGGTWKASLEIFDRVGNMLTEDASTLAAGGHPTDLNVDCGAGSSTFMIRFISNTTITWDPVPDAFFYNVYRGDLAELGTTYGTCQNANDPNPTDTIYIDTEIPTPGEGFAYLVSYRLISGEDGLGTNSDGIPRVIAVPCP